MKLHSPLLMVTLLFACCSDMKNTTTPPGDLNNFDPIAGFAAAASYAGPEAKLVSFSARFVRVDGTMDLEAKYFPAVYMAFVTKATAEDVATQQDLAPGSGFREGELIKTELSIISPRWMKTTSSLHGTSTAKHLGMKREPSAKFEGEAQFAPPPTCKLADLWKTAIEKGAPSDVVGIFSYNDKGYTFEANGQPFRMSFDAACQPKNP